MQHFMDIDTISIRRTMTTTALFTLVRYENSNSTITHRKF